MPFLTQHTLVTLMRDTTINLRYLLKYLHFTFVKFHRNIACIGNSIQLLLGQVLALGRARRHRDHHHCSLGVDSEHENLLGDWYLPE